MYHADLEADDMPRIDAHTEEELQPTGWEGRLLALLRAGALGPPGRSLVVHIYHAPWCRYPDGGACTCTPYIAVPGREARP